MAHLPNDDLPAQFDVIVDGTGLVQSILAAALAVAGKSVLHIDGNSYYGEQWASLMHRELVQWVAEHNDQSHDLSHDQATPPENSPDERVIPVKRPPPTTRISNLVEIIHKRLEEPTDTATGTQPSTQVANQDPTTQETGVDSTQAASQGPTSQAATQDSTSQAATQDSTTQADGGEDVPNADQDERESVGPAAAEPPPQGAVAAIAEPLLTWQSLESQRRRFNYDIMPKVLYCRGALVNLLTQSNCGRYVEFKAVNKIFTKINGKTEQVPCSRADVFSSKSVSMLEKRKMMKFLTFCAEFEKHPEEYEEFVLVPYGEFLRLKDLTPNLVQYIVHCIAMVTEDTPTLQALKATQIFLNSLGRFGNAPFLSPIFGVGELPQAFCRLCAVFGGVYCLRRCIGSLLVSSAENKMDGIICSTGQRIACSYVVTSAALLKDTIDFQESLSTSRFSRGIFVTDGPVQDTEGRLMVLTIPPFSLGSSQTVAVYVLQLDSSTNNTAEGTYMIHLLCPSISATAQQDLEYVARSLFKIEDQTESNSTGPRLLWSLYYNVSVHSVNQDHVASLDIPTGVHVTSDPDGTLAYENAVREAREIFERICPGKEFMPRPPDPEDIIFEGNNEGDEEEQAVPTGEGESPPSQPTNESAEQTGGEVTPTEEQNDTVTEQQ